MDRDAARQIATSDWPSKALSVSAGMPSSLLPKWLQGDSRMGELFIEAHDILDDKADWNSATWLFNPAEVPRFVVTLERLYELLAEDFELVASWGDEPSREQPVTRTELMGIVSNNQLGNAVLYHVSAR